MKIPNKIKVGGFTFRILYGYCFRERTDIDGQCDYGLQEIRIKTTDEGGCKYSDSYIIKTLLHELLHAILFSFCHKQSKGDLTEEDFIESTAQGLLSVMKNNPELFCNLMNEIPARGEN